MARGADNILTDRQREILEYVAAYSQQYGIAPSVRQIGEAVGLRSSSTVHGHLQRLMAKGYLVRKTGTPRGLMLAQRRQTAPTRDVAGLAAQFGVPLPVMERIDAYYRSVLGA